MNFISNRTCKPESSSSPDICRFFCFGSFTKVHYTKCLIADGYYKVLSKTKSKHFFLSSPNQLLLRQVKLLKIKIFFCFHYPELSQSGQMCHHHHSKIQRIETYYTHDIGCCYACLHA